jgi:2-succinyl-5-enolpyruvyl-6-hydroxy-3-cyclohexene-1-carboxylate synthase
MTVVNRNYLWTSTFVDELFRSGVRHAVIAPGSRSTPLVIAFAEHGGFTIHSIIDERSAAFFALGIGMATGVPAALVCSSGTATANFYPAVIEARYSNVPLLVLTADRPHELRDSGANQTVNQINLYGQHVLWAVDVALPEQSPAPVMLRSLRTLACRAVSTTIGIESGPVHLNFPFRKPLEPIPVLTDTVDSIPLREDAAPFTAISRGIITPTTEQISSINHLLQQARRPLIIAGPRAAHSPTDPLVDAARRFSSTFRIPLLADPLSNLRYAASGALSAYDIFLSLEQIPDIPDLVLLLGGMPASKALEDFFVKTDLPAVLLLTDSGRWTDPYHRLTHLVHANPAHTLDILAQKAQPHPTADPVWWSWFNRQEEITHKAFAHHISHYWFDGAAVSSTLTSLPRHTQIIIGNSLPVRHLEQFGIAAASPLRIFCNRGASGIDGTVSTAYGIAAASPNAPTVFITGDLAFYHDMNGLLAAKRTVGRVIIILINNDGGGIFRRLPIADFEPAFTQLFLTPHGLDFSHAAKLYGIHYARANDTASLTSALWAALNAEASAIIEVCTNGEQDAVQRQALLNAIQSHLSSPVTP